MIRTREGWGNNCTKILGNNRIIGRQCKVRKKGRNDINYGMIKVKLLWKWYIVKNIREIQWSTKYLGNNIYQILGYQHEVQNNIKNHIW